MDRDMMLAAATLVMYVLLVATWLVILYGAVVAIRTRRDTIADTELMRWTYEWDPNDEEGT